MIITCSECATSFKVPEGIFHGNARKLRCTRCSHTWLEELEAQSGGQDNSPDIPGDPDSEPGGDEVMEDIMEVPRQEPAETGEAEKETAPDETIKEEPVVKTSKNHYGYNSYAGLLKKAGGALAIAASVALLAWGATNFRESVVRYLPGTADFYAKAGMKVNLAGMDFSGIRLSHDYEGGFPVLTVHGEIVNVSEKTIKIPGVRFGLRNEGEAELYHWSIDVSKNELKPNERINFVTRLASPPEDAREIVIRFERHSDRKMGVL